MTETKQKNRTTTLNKVPQDSCRRSPEYSEPRGSGRASALSAAKIERTYVRCYHFERGLHDAVLCPCRRPPPSFCGGLLIPPDALPFQGNPNGEFLGYTWMALPFTDPTVGDSPTGDQSRTCFLIAANFKGPIAYYIPETWSKIGKLVDGSGVTYSWYRFVDQPSFQQYSWIEEKKEKQQSFVEKLHANWPTDRDYMAPPTR